MSRTPVHQRAMPLHDLHSLRAGECAACDLVPREVALQWNVDYGPPFFYDDQGELTYYPEQVKQWVLAHIAVHPPEGKPQGDAAGGERA